MSGSDLSASDADLLVRARRWIVAAAVFAVLIPVGTLLAAAVAPHDNPDLPSFTRAVPDVLLAFAAACLRRGLGGAAGRTAAIVAWVAKLAELAVGDASLLAGLVGNGALAAAIASEAPGSSRRALSGAAGIGAVATILPSVIMLAGEFLPRLPFPRTEHGPASVSELLADIARIALFVGLARFARARLVPGASGSSDVPPELRDRVEGLRDFVGWARFRAACVLVGTLAFLREALFDRSWGTPAVTFGLLMLATAPLLMSALRRMRSGDPDAPTRRPATAALVLATLRAIVDAPLVLLLLFSGGGHLGTTDRQVLPVLALASLAAACLTDSLVGVVGRRLAAAAGASVSGGRVQAATYGAYVSGVLLVGGAVAMTADAGRSAERVLFSIAWLMLALALALRELAHRALLRAMSAPSASRPAAPE